MKQLESFLRYINPLYGQNKDVKNHFDKWYESSKLIQIRAVTILTGILYIIYSQIDKEIAPACVLPVMTFLHLYILPSGLFLIAVLTFSKKLYKTMVFLLIIAPVGAALGNLFLLISLNDFTVYMPELYLIIIWTFAISGLRLSHAMISATATVLFIILINKFLFPISKEQFYMHSLWTLSAFSFGLLTAFILEKFSKIIFLKNNELEKLSITDGLTTLYNRFKIENILENELARAKRYKRVLSIVLLDIDDFKNVNDNYGHNAGDTVLKEFANILKVETRAVDYLGRWGGEEFLIVLSETDVSEAEKAAEHLRKEIENFEFSIIKSKTACFGIAEYKDGDTVESLVNRADKALYEAKNNGKNKVEVL